MSAPERTRERLDVALELARVGYYLAPVTLKRGPDGKKRPRYYGSWDKMSTRDPAQIRDWLVQYDCSFLVDTGKSGAVAVDLDLADNRDGIAAWEALNGPCGGIVVDTPSGGQHHYFAADPGRPLINSADPATGIDTRAEGGHVYAPGAVILGADDEPEPGGYRARGPLYAPGDLPPVPELLHARRKERSPRSELAREDRRFTNAEAKAYIQTKLDELTNAVEGGRNVALNTAAFRIGHFVSDEFGTTYEAAVAALVAHLPDGYGDAPGEARELDATIRSGLTDGIEDGTYVRRRVEPESPLDAESAEALRARKVAERVEWLRIEREARAEVARELRADHLSIESGLVDDLDAIEPPVMLMESLIPEASIGFLAGKSGAYKSFLAASWACCIATGRPWLGDDRFAVRRPLKVLYVAAEGPSGVAGRIRAWEASAHGTSRRGRVVLHKRPIHLNDEQRADELAEVIERHGFEFLIVDTYHRSAPGTEENSATDFGHVYEAVATLRDRFGIGVLFVDHTGAAKSGNPRGTSAKRDDSDYVLSVSYPGEEATPAAQRELWVTKLKDEDTSGRWPIRLASVDGQHFPVVEIGPLGKVDPIVLDHSWLGIAQARVPSEVRAIDGKAGEAAVDVWRVLAYNGGERGLTQAEIVRVLTQAERAAPAYRQPSKGSLGRALTDLVTAGAIRRGETDSRWVAALPGDLSKIVKMDPDGS